ncbi:MAG: hypothetical protein PVI21_00830 [Candidatus Woesebacteria bacterium]|jgi:hypothetical protein
MRRITEWLLASLAVVTFLTMATSGSFGGSYGGNIATNASPSPSFVSLGDFTVIDSTIPAQPQGEVGPGECWLRDETPKANDDLGFAEENGPQMASEWLLLHQAEAEKLDRFYNAHKDYYLVDETVPDWDNLTPVQRVSDYVSQLMYIELPATMLVLNHYCPQDSADVQAWQTQVLPVGEVVFFVPGHEPGTEDVRPAHKAVCGNPLLPPVAPSGSPGVTPSATPSETPTKSRTTSPPELPGKATAPQPAGVEKPINNPAAPTAETRPTANSGNVLVPQTTAAPAPKVTARSTPPPETAAPAPTNPGTNAGCPPGITAC